MSKGCNCCGELVREPRFFTAVTDYEIKRGTIGNMEIDGTYRVFNDKFVDSPEKALFLAFDENNKRWKIPAEKIMEGVTYNEETQEFTKTYLETLDGHRPSDKQMKRFESGEYEFNLITMYVQVFETKLIDRPEMLKEAVTSWKKRMEDCK